MGFMFDAFARASDRLGEWFRTLSDNEIDLKVETVAVDWIGGPFDGLRRDVETADVWHLPPVLEMPVSQAEIERTEDQAPRNIGMPTSLSVYQLEIEGDRWLYRFVEAWPARTSSLTP